LSSTKESDSKVFNALNDVSQDSSSQCCTMKSLKVQQMAEQLQEVGVSLRHTRGFTNSKNTQQLQKHLLQVKNNLDNVQ